MLPVTEGLEIVGLTQGPEESSYGWSISGVGTKKSHHKFSLIFIPPIISFSFCSISKYASLERRTCRIRPVCKSSPSYSFRKNMPIHSIDAIDVIDFFIHFKTVMVLAFIESTFT